jgi:hypothetical protein
MIHNIQFELRDGVLISEFFSPYILILYDMIPYTDELIPKLYRIEKSLKFNNIPVS